MSEAPPISPPPTPGLPDQRWRRLALVASIVSTPILAALGIIYELEWAWTLVVANAAAIGTAAIVHALTRRMDLQGFAVAARAVGEAWHGPK